MQQKNSIEKNILLLGGDGFLGSGLNDEFSKRTVKFTSLDKKDFDFTRETNIEKISNDIRRHTDVVMLASDIGRTIFEKNPFFHSRNNRKINENIFKAIELSESKPNVVLYSTSEVYGSNENITENSNYNIDFDNPRSLYSLVKIESEMYLKNMLENGKISSLLILYPFNVFGIHQKRGVLYDMMLSARNKREIFFNKNTTRTMTYVNDASRDSANMILSSYSFTKKNIVDEKMTVSMEFLANIVKNEMETVFGNEILLKEEEIDKSLQFRGVSLTDSNKEYTESKIIHGIYDIIRTDNAFRI